MIIFGFGTFRPKAAIKTLLSTLASEFGTEFGIHAAVGNLEDSPESQVDLLLVDVSKQLQTLHVSGLGKIQRLFVFQGGPTKVTEGLQRFIQSLSALHGKPVKFIYDQERIEENVYQIDTVMKQTALGFHMGNSSTPTDLGELASALFQEYYSLRIRQIKNNRIDHIIENLALEAMKETQKQIAVTAQTEEVYGAGESAVADPVSGHNIPDAAERFLNNVLQSLDVPFRVKYLFFRYITLRISMGQPLQGAVTDLLPLVMDSNAFEQLSLQMKMELEIHSVFEKH